MDELEQGFIKKYGPEGGLSRDGYFKILITLPIFVIVVISTSCIWWAEHEKRKVQEQVDREKREKALLARATQGVVQPPKPKIVSKIFSQLIRIRHDTKIQEWKLLFIEYGYYQQLNDGLKKCSNKNKFHFFCPVCFK